MPSYYSSVLVVVVVATELGGWHACRTCGLGAYYSWGADGGFWKESVSNEGGGAWEQRGWRSAEAAMVEAFRTAHTELSSNASCSK